MQPESSSGQSTPETLHMAGSNTAPPVKRRRISSSWGQPGKNSADQTLDTTGNQVDSEMTDAPVNGSASASIMHPPQWQDTIEMAVQSIVSIRASQVSAFDTEREFHLQCPHYFGTA
jgi:hypothetical protein